MADYMNFLDLAAINCADEAFANKQYNVSTLLYNMAHKKLMRYNGDRMQPIQMAGPLKEKLQKSEIAWARNPQQIRLTYSTWKLTKTSFVKGKQCSKQLYLDKYNKNERTPPTQETRDLWTRGRNFEDKVRKNLFPHGLDVSKAVASKFGYYYSYTNDALLRNSAITLFEATVIVDNILVMVDILDKDQNDNLDFYEIKLNSEITEGILWDLSVQYYVVKKRFGDKVKSFSVILRDGENDWQIVELKDKLEEKLDETKLAGLKFLQIIENDTEPVVKMGPHCDMPYSCDFKNYCSKLKQNI